MKHIIINIKQKHNIYGYI